MKKVHEVTGFINPEGTDIVRYVHERHPVGQCAWCDFVRSRSIAREFITRLEMTIPDCENLNMWSLGTSMHDTKFNRKILVKRWAKLRNRLHKRGYSGIVFRVLECGNRGYIHIHFVAVSFIPHKVVLDAWREICGEKANVHVSGQKGAQDVKRLTRYLTKYLTKSSSDYRWCGPFYGLGKDRDRSVRAGSAGPSPVYGGVTYLTMTTEQSKYYGCDEGVQVPIVSSGEECDNE